MKPISLHGHERSITQIVYNREGDLLFSSAKDQNPNVWYSINGERLGTYDGHGKWIIETKESSIPKKIQFSWCCALLNIFSSKVEPYGVLMSTGKLKISSQVLPTTLFGCGMFVQVKNILVIIVGSLTQIIYPFKFIRNIIT